MMFKWLSLILRVLIAVGLGIFLLRFVGVSLLLPVVAVLYGGILFLLFGIPLLRRAGEGASQLFWPDDSHFRVMPEYSLAEARFKEGQYEQAAEEFQKIIVQYPDDVYPHLRVAELAVAHLHDYKLAELALLSAVAKAEGEHTSALAAGRLADFYQQTLHDPERAVQVMKQLKEKLAGSKHAKLVDERIATLEKMVRGYKVPEPPLKITVKPADEAAIRRRRGF
jgi:tetratricopeptide (TPR) repeat protein